MRPQANSPAVWQLTLFAVLLLLAGKMAWAETGPLPAPKDIFLSPPGAAAGTNPASPDPLLMAGEVEPLDSMGQEPGAPTDARAAAPLSAPAQEGALMAEEPLDSMSTEETFSDGSVHIRLRSLPYGGEAERLPILPPATGLRYRPSDAEQEN